MCGIIGAINIDSTLGNVNEDIINQFQDQKTRGVEGFGAVIIKKDKTIQVKRATTETKLLVDLLLEQNQSEMIIMHHRTPTSTPNKIGQTHPIETDNGSLKYKYLTIHNGVIHNDDSLKSEHEKLGFQYTTEMEKTGYNNLVETVFNDSEAVSIEIARFIENQVQKLKVEGSIAFITLQISKKTNKVRQIFFGRNDRSPLKLSKNNKKIRLSSEGQGDEVKSNMLYSFNLEDFKINKKSIIFEMAEDDKDYIRPTQSVVPYNTTTNPKPFNLPKAQPSYSTYNHPKDDLPIMEFDITNKMREEIDAVMDKLETMFGNYEDVMSIDVEEVLRQIAVRIFEAKRDMGKLMTDELTDTVKNYDSIGTTYGDQDYADGYGFKGGDSDMDIVKV